MGKTLFWYLFRDLMRIFFLSSIVIAGIMGFGGLLQPITKFGLDVTRVVQMWLYLMPAMMTYSMPIAAVFASSMVYGRLSADNELTACRAAGISYKTIAAPGLALGLLAAITSLVFLSFIVPFFFYQAEGVVYANVAKYIASSIERTHSFHPPGSKEKPIFAQAAHIPAEPGPNGEQTIVLSQPTIIKYAQDPKDPELRVPESFSVAEEATLFIRHDESGDVVISGVLKGPATFTRDRGAGPQGGLDLQMFNPITMPSPMRQQVKFMDIKRLKELANDPDQTDRVRKEVAKFVRAEQVGVFFHELSSALKSPRPEYVFRAAETHILSAPGADIQSNDRFMTLKANRQPIRLTRQSAGRSRVYEASAVRITPEMENDAQRIILTIEMDDVTIIDAGDRIQKSTDMQVLSVPMSEQIHAIRGRKAADYLIAGWQNDMNRIRLVNRLMVSRNEIAAEMHARASFGVSCLVLVMVGTVLGMLLRSGDFLSAFAASVIPALATITLVVAGMQTATNVGDQLQDHLWLGLAIIWLGNIIALIIALALFRKLRRS